MAPLPRPDLPRPPAGRWMWPFALALLATATFIWSALLPIVTTDIANDYIPWFDQAVAAGGFAVFRAPWGAYTPPYLYCLAALVPLKGLIADVYIVKLVSLGGTLALAAATWRLLRALHVREAVPIALCIPAVPTVLLNAAALGQCDALFAAPLLLNLAAAVEGRHRTMLAWCGLALAIKLQAILFAPFIIGLLLARRVPLRDWFVAPATFLLPFLPAWAIGWPLADLVAIYARQSDTFPELSRNAPNIWSLVQSADLGQLPLTGLAIAAAVGASAILIARMMAEAGRLSPLALVRFALLASLLTAGLLPRMHERYFFVADMLALVLFACQRDRASAYIALLVQAGSLLALFAYTSGAGELAGLGGVLMIAATALVVRATMPTVANDNPLPLRATSAT